MVHALEEIKRLLNLDGCLIDIHPIRNAPLIKVVQGDDILFVESDPGYDYDDDILHAEEALDEVIQRGLYIVEGTKQFELVTRASSVVEMRDYWEKYGVYDDEPKDDAIITRQNVVYARADEILQNVSGTEITYHEQACITRLKPSQD